LWTWVDLNIPAAMDSTSQPAPRFMPTRWSVVLAAREEDSPQAEAALATLCQAYWYPLYAFVRRQGHSPADAQDLTQEFFARLIEKRYLARIHREGGRFRSFLLTALKRFLANEWDRAQAQKRGGGKTVVSIDGNAAETRYRLEPVHDETPERIYERHWAQTLLGQVLVRLESEYGAEGKAKLFECIHSSLSQPRGSMPYAEIANRLGLTEAAVKMSVQRLRARYRELLRAEIAQTVGAPSEIEDELRYLFATFGG
jgi:RNA polymerase sigma-70 factor (ECF subfamily)